MKTIPKQTLEELLISEEERVNFDRSESSKFTIITDPRFEGQFRVEGDKIERVVNQMNWVSIIIIIITTTTTTTTTTTSYYNNNDYNNTHILTLPLLPSLPSPTGLLRSC